jgi:hypothetical protein
MLASRRWLFGVVLVVMVAASVAAKAQHVAEEGKP